MLVSVLYHAVGLVMLVMVVSLVADGAVVSLYSEPSCATTPFSITTVDSADFSCFALKPYTLSGTLSCLPLSPAAFSLRLFLGGNCYQTPNATAYGHASSCQLVRTSNGGALFAVEVNCTTAATLNNSRSLPSAAALSNVSVVNNVTALP